jgi:PHS family inorganic phosphate transporter-like MFS transporter
MQPLGQLSAYLVGLITFAVLNKVYDIENKTDHTIVAPIVDQAWRWVTGLGAIPAIIALIFRLTIPESGRWTLDVQGEADRAVLETRAHFGPSSSISLDEDLELQDEANTESAIEAEVEPLKPFSKEDLRQYFLTKGNWRYLAGTASCWFLLDFAYYGLQINNPRFLAKLWANNVPKGSPSSIPAWLSDPDVWNSATSEASTTMYKVNQDNAVHAMIAVSIGAVLGGLLLIKIIPYIPRRKFLIWSFAWMAVLCAATGVSYLKTFRTPYFGVTLMLFILCQLFFNLGKHQIPQRRIPS